MNNIELYCSSIVISGIPIYPGFKLTGLWLNLKINIHTNIIFLTPLKVAFMNVYIILQDINISASVSGRGQLIFGDHDGYLHMLNRELQINSFKAYEIRVSHLFQMKQHNLLISIGVSIKNKNIIICQFNRSIYINI